MMTPTDENKNNRNGNADHDFSDIEIADDEPSDGKVIEVAYDVDTKIPSRSSGTWKYPYHIFVMVLIAIVVIVPLCTATTFFLNGKKPADSTHQVNSAVHNELLYNSTLQEAIKQAMDENSTTEDKILDKSTLQEATTKQAMDGNRFLQANEVFLISVNSANVQSEKESQCMQLYTVDANVIAPAKAAGANGGLTRYIPQTIEIETWHYNSNDPSCQNSGAVAVPQTLLKGCGFVFLDRKSNGPFSLSSSKTGQTFYPQLSDLCDNPSAYKNEIESFLKYGAQLYNGP